VEDHTLMLRMAVPVSYFLGTVGDDVVEDDMELLHGVGPQQLVHERDELARTLVILDAGNDPTCMDFQRCLQLHGAVSFVVMTVSLDLVWLHRQHRLGTIQSLDLRLLIDAQDDRVLWRIQVQPDHIEHLLDEIRIGRAGARPHSMGFQLVLA